MTDKRAGRRWVAVLATVAVLASGCSAAVDRDALPGAYRSDKTGAEIRLDSSGTFSATGVSAHETTGDESADPADFRGRWELVDSETTSDFVYLTIEGGGLGTIGGVQLYPGGRETMEFRADPDGPPSLVLTRTTAP